jgi:hypothetical protein
MLTISAALHLAADQYLWDGVNSFYRRSDTEGFSCWAIDNAIDSYRLPWRDFGDFSERINEGLTTLGLDTGSMKQFNEFSTDEERQGARYLWLKFAALLAEEQGV